jgi:AraC-like DNA-binding protein
MERSTAESNEPVSAFFAQVASEPLLRALIQSFQGASFVIKDRAGRYIVASDGAYQRYGLSCEAEILGRTDSEFVSQKFVDLYGSTDQRVMETGEPILGMVEIGFDSQQVPDWLLTQKFPILNQAKEVIGVLVVLQSYEGQRASLAVHESLRQAVAFLEKNLERQVPLAELAAHAGLSERHLQRKFQGTFGMSVQEFAVYLRIQSAARELRNTDKSVAEVAALVGFSDQSAFSRKFREMFGVSPREYRQKR